MKYVTISILAACILTSCASVPQKEYDEAALLRKRASRYEPVRTYESESFAAAEKSYMQADTLIKQKKDLKTAKEALTNASAQYRIVIDKGMPAYAGDLSTQIDKTIRSADELKAKIALEVQYEKAAVLYEEAKKQASSGDYDSALEKFENAKTDFETVYTQVQKKYAESKNTVEALQGRLSKLEQMVRELEQTGERR